MKYIFLHGLGQTAQSWQEVICQLDPEWDVLCTDLAEWLLGKEACYRTLYQKLEEYCGQLEESLCLCGLSLGGILALDFAANHPDRVCRLVLMGTPYKMPRKLLKLQDVLFHFMPERAFLDIGFEKKAFIGLCRSMAALDFEKRLNRIAAAICDELERTVKGKIVTHASITARPFFEKRGYTVIKEQQVERQGVLLTNFVMEKGR